MKYSRIAYERKKNGLSQLELANKLGISQKSISKYERGDRRPTYETLTAMAKLFGVSVDYLLGIDTENKSVQKCNSTDAINSISEEKYFYFFFNDEDLLRDVFSQRVKAALADIGLTEGEFKEHISFGPEKAASFLAGDGDPTANDLIELSKFLNTSIDYLLGQVPRITNQEKNLLNAFIKLNKDNQDILIGKAKELVKEQRYEESVAADDLPRTGTDQK